MNGEQDPKHVLKYLKRQGRISEAGVERFQWTVRALGGCVGMSWCKEHRIGRAGGQRGMSISISVSGDLANGAGIKKVGSQLSY